MLDLAAGAKIINDLDNAVFLVQLLLQNLRSLIEFYLLHNPNKNWNKY